MTIPPYSEAYSKRNELTVTRKGVGRRSRPAGISIVKTMRIKMKGLKEINQRKKQENQSKSQLEDLSKPALRPTIRRPCSKIA